MRAQLIGTKGLFFDILGAVLVAIDLFKTYAGDTFTQGSQTDITPPEENPEYMKHRKQNRYLALVGLGLLIVGFFFQICALWMQ